MRDAFCIGFICFFYTVAVLTCINQSISHYVKNVRYVNLIPRYIMFNTLPRGLKNRNHSFKSLCKLQNCSALYWN